MTISKANNNRLRIAELTSSIGALALGIGLGALLSRWLADTAVWILLAGGLTHGWGMYDKNRLERSAAAADVWWHPYVYWLCWIALILGGAVLVATSL